MKGRKAKPTNLKLLSGNPSERAIKAEARAEKLSPDLTDELPAWLPAGCAEFWAPITSVLRSMGIVKESDKIALVMLCISLVDVKSARAKIAKEGYTVAAIASSDDEGNAVSFGEPKTNPHFTVQSKAMVIILRLLAEFGMTPSARARVLGMTAPSETDALTQFLSGKAKEA